MISETVSFAHDGEKVRWTFLHNLNDYDISLEDAFINWSAITKEYSPEAFCEYVILKSPIYFECKCTHQTVID